MGGRGERWGGKRHEREALDTSKCADFTPETWVAGLGVALLGCDWRERERGRRVTEVWWTGIEEIISRVTESCFRRADIWGMWKEYEDQTLHEAQLSFLRQTETLINTLLQRQPLRWLIQALHSRLKGVTAEAEHYCFSESCLGDWQHLKQMQAFSWGKTHGQIKTIHMKEAFDAHSHRQTVYMLYCSSPRSVIITVSVSGCSFLLTHNTTRQFSFHSFRTSLCCINLKYIYISKK